MAKHMPSVRAEVESYFAKLRQLKIEAVTRLLAEAAPDSNLSAAAVVTIIQSIAQGLKAEQALGANLGHNETRSIVEGWLRDISRLRESFHQT
jgi:hypothetical protein